MAVSSIITAFDATCLVVSAGKHLMDWPYCPGQISVIRVKKWGIDIYAVSLKGMLMLKGLKL